MRILYSAFLLVALSSQCALAAPTMCKGDYYQDQAPDLVNYPYASHLHELCNTAYATMYSGVTKTALWSADHLTRDHIYQGKGMKRVDSFRPDTRLPASERTELDDWHSGQLHLDRGHVVPNADAYDEQTQYETFLLSNMMPQASENNRGLWAGQESAARMLAKSSGEVYVVSGPLFIGEHLQKLNGKIMIPTHLFKAIYDPVNHQAGAYVDTNDGSQNYQVMSLDELTKFAGINPFPALKGSIRTTAMKLPKPIAPNFNDSASNGNTSHQNNYSTIEHDAYMAEKLIKHLLH